MLYQNLGICSKNLIINQVYFCFSVETVQNVVVRDPVSEFAVGQEAVYIAYELICCRVPEVRILADEFGYDI